MTTLTAKETKLINQTIAMLTHRGCNHITFTIEVGSGYAIGFTFINPVKCFSDTVKGVCEAAIGGMHRAEKV